MRWKQGRRSTNVEDRRRHRLGRAPRPMLAGSGLIIFFFVAILLGADPSEVLSILDSQIKTSASPAHTRPRLAREDYSEAADFTSVVLADTEDTWKKIFAQQGLSYPSPKLVLFSDAVQSACGFNRSASGPFYCPPDQKVYIDLSFLNQLKQLGAPGDFAFAYVVAHEIAHHVQNVSGTIAKVSARQKELSKEQANSLQVKVELQADCLAGVWAHHGHRDRAILEEGDIEEGLQAAAAVGDDRLQKMAGRGVHPETFTHGTSEQRRSWFYTGLKTGSISACDTFSS